MALIRAVNPCIFEDVYVALFLHNFDSIAYSIMSYILVYDLVSQEGVFFDFPPVAIY